MKKITAILFFATGLFAFSAQAQIKLNHLEAGISYWNRSYSDLDERAFLMNYEEDSDFTKGGVIPHIGAEVNLYKGLALDGRVGFWTGDFSQKVTFGGGLVISESIDQTIIPVSLGLVYNFDGVFNEAINLFAGAGLNRYFIQNKVERTSTEGGNSSDSFNGNNYGANFKAGAEYLLNSNFGLALEAGYNTGSYNQNYQADTDSQKESYEVSVQGLEVGLSLRYRFSAQ
ncbi:outer membrane beta-barrel protein [Salinimicrobium soli]|uniref:outer membrane beta-barrel protein n=2 Tax=Bacteria TaxID=2 RepID=UPI003AAAF3CB